MQELNPRNPYPHQIAYDQHVWLPRAQSNHFSLADLPDDCEAIGDLIMRVFPEVVLVDHGREHQRIIQETLLSRADPDQLRQVAERCVEMGLRPIPRNLLSIGAHSCPGFRDALRIVADNPPEDVHRMQKGDPYYIGDIYSANMILSSLRHLGLDVDDGRRYLDFGCSSGSLIRMLRAYCPNAQLYGVDPIPEAIAWAQAHIEGCTFQNSRQTPPLDFPDGFFDGATAVSIWSHLGEELALQWFDELHRCLAPGAWLCFTTHGIISVHRYCRTKDLPARRVKALLEGLMNGDFVFEEIYLDESPEGLDAQGYGNAYFHRSWVFRHLSAKWRILSYEPGLNQRNQDIYILGKID